MIYSSEFQQVMDNMTGYKRQWNIHGFYNKFEVLLSPGKRLFNNKTLYLATEEVFKSIDFEEIENHQNISIIVSSENENSLCSVPDFVLVNSVNLPIEDVINVVASSMTFNEPETPPETENRYISAFLSDLVSGHIAEHEEIIKNLKRTPIKILNHVAIIVVSTFNPNKKLKVSDVSNFASCFPNCISCYYHGDILILTQKNDYPDPMACLTDRLEKTLEEYDCIAVQSEYTKWLTSIPPSYIKAKKLVKYLQLGDISQKRYVHAIDFELYNQLDIIMSYVKDYCRGDIHHICNPEIGFLKEHDLEAGTNYCTLLATYIDCERNISLTAEKMFYHRNTLKSKLEDLWEYMISEYIYIDLDDPIVRYNVRISLYILEYMEPILKRKRPFTEIELGPSTAEQLKI